MDYLQKWKCFKAAPAISIQLHVFGRVAPFKKGGNKANRGEPGSWHGAGNHSVISAHLCTQISSCATPGTWIYMKVSLLITIAVGGLVHPVSPKNKGVDSQTQVDESQKAELVTPQLLFALQGLPLPGPGWLSCVASRRRQQSKANTARTLDCLNTGIQCATSPRFYVFSSVSQQVSTRGSAGIHRAMQPLSSARTLQLEQPDECFVPFGKTTCPRSSIVHWLRSPLSDHSTHIPTPSRSGSAPPRHTASGFSHKTSIFRHAVSFKRKTETSSRKHCLETSWLKTLVSFGK